MARRGGRGGEGRERAEMNDMNELRHLRGLPGQHNGFHVALREQSLNRCEIICTINLNVCLHPINYVYF